MHILVTAKIIDGKLYVSADSLLYDSYKLAKKILDSGFKPDFIVGIWRGGAPVGIAVQEYLDYHGIKTDHIAIRTSAYKGIGQMKKEIQVHNLGYVSEKAVSKNKMLIVDDVYDSGLSFQAVLDAMKEKLRDNLPQDIRVATVYFKPEKNQTDKNPDYYVHESNEWIVFPHELAGLTKEEISKGKGQEIGKLV